MTITKSQSILLDKFYTKPSIAKHCLEVFNKTLENININQPLYLEPSAGSGIFIDQILNNKQNCVGIDISPEREDIYQADFLNKDIRPLLNEKQTVVLGNPPFGKRAKLAIDFINKSFEYSDIVGFILPIQFQKWQTQKQIDIKAQLIFNETLPHNAFELNGKTYKVRSCFQIWTKKVNNNFKDLRKYHKPDIEHPDFKCYQYNCTTVAEKYFDYDWDFAVLRQGYGNHNILYYNKEELSRKKQWMFFKASNENTLKLLKSIDFNKLSEKNTSTVSGFGKADIVEAYNQLKNKNI